MYVETPLAALVPPSATAGHGWGAQHESSPVGAHPPGSPPDRPMLQPGDGHSVSGPGLHPPGLAAANVVGAGVGPTLARHQRSHWVPPPVPTVDWSQVPAAAAHLGARDAAAGRIEATDRAMEVGRWQVREAGRWDADLDYREDVAEAAYAMRCWLARDDCGTLDLAERRLRSLPIGLGTWVGMHSLDLEANALPEQALACIAGLTSLSWLSVSANGLLGLPDAWTALTNLTHLYSEANAHRRVPACLMQLTGLEVLSLAGNPLESLPEPLAADALAARAIWPRLRHLDLGQGPA